MRLLLITFFVVAFAGKEPVEKELKLEYKFRVGDVFEYAQLSRQNAVQTLPGMGETKMDGLLAGTMLFKIKSVDANGSARIETQYTKLKMVTNNFLMSMSMDSEGSQEEDGNRIVRSMTGKPFFFTLTKTGAVEDVDGVENVYSGLGALELDDDVVAKARKTLQQTINDRSIKTLLENGLVAYPDRSVKSGDTWNTASVQAVNFPMKIENTWTLQGADAGVANIACESNLTTIDKQKINNLVNGMRSKSDLNGTQKMSGRVDLKSGWPKEIKILSDIKGTMTLIAGGLIPQDMEIPMTVKIETTYSVTRK